MSRRSSRAALVDAFRQLIVWARDSGMSPEDVARAFGEALTKAGGGETVIADDVFSIAVKEPRRG